MARKPAQLELAGGRGPRQRIWEFIRANRTTFTVLDVEKATVIAMPTIRTYLLALDRGGFIAMTNNAARYKDRKEYKLVRDMGAEAPRITRDGKPLPPTGQENMWRTMRIAGTFTAEELAARSTTAETRVGVTTAKGYITDLTRAGYLVLIDPGHAWRAGIGAKQARYRFVAAKYTGPRPPMIQRTKGLYDPNLGKLVWQEEPDHDAA
ncbi:hypothetical protein [Burkholderia gladioli]|jgi:hypothetical protein|nr:hypothetical protein [Burkholderia gladioli]